MTFRIAGRIIARIRTGPTAPAAASLLLAACTCAGKPGDNPAPAVARPAASAPAAPKPALDPAILPPPIGVAPIAEKAPPAVAPARPTAAPARPDAGAAPPAAKPLPPEKDPVLAKHKEHERACGRLIDSIGAPGAQKAVFARPEMMHAGGRGRMIAQYLSCRAIELDDPSRCALCGEVEDQYKCRERFERYRALKGAGSGKAWLFTDEEYKRCRALPMAGACDAFRDVARSGDVGRCPRGDYEAYCRALFTLDRTQCRGSGPNAEGIRELCLEAIDEKHAGQNGLAALARSGPLAEQMFARAALGQPNACGDFVLLLEDTCTKNFDAADPPVIARGER